MIFDGVPSWHTNVVKALMPRSPSGMRFARLRCAIGAVVIGRDLLYLFRTAAALNPF
jgi:hypothetical protein